MRKCITFCLFKRITTASKPGASIFLTTLLLASCGSKQPVKATPPAASLLTSFQVVSNLDMQLTETSGLETYRSGLITHNDSGDQPVLYFIDTLGNIKSRSQFQNMSNVDWEDVAKSDTDFYIADIGNNYGDRKDLTVYQIPIEDLKNTQVAPKKVFIAYADQKSFKRKNQRHAFDGEAIVYAKDELLLFSKNWIDFDTHVYELLQEQDNTSLKSRQKINVNGLVTGATYNGKNRIVLCGYNSSLNPFIAVLEYNEGKQLNLIERIVLPIENGAQVEAITFYQNKNSQETYYLTSEAVNIKLGEDEATSNGQLYKFTLKAQ